MKRLAKTLMAMAAAAMAASCSCNQSPEANYQQTDSLATDTVVAEPVAAPREPEVMSTDKPLAVEIRRERSYYQAARIQRRLERMGVEAYVLEKGEKDGTWYRVVSGALENDSAAKAYITHLDTAFNLPKGKVVNYAKLDSAQRTPVVKEQVKTEVARIDALKPDVPQAIHDVVAHFPQSDMFQLQNIGMCMLTEKGIGIAKNMKLDMPRGISLQTIKKHGGVAFASVQFKDNLFGDNITVQVVRLKDKPQKSPASFVPIPTERNAEALELCSLLADKTLNTGKYVGEDKDGVEVESYSKLTGYKASFFERNKKRSYLFLTDEAGEYIYMAQSTKKGDEEVLEFLAEVGKSGGLVEYGEFYNSFYTVANQQMKSDTFLGYTTDKLTNSYAKQKGFADWSKKMVGHWCSTTYTDAGNKGTWCYALFDLVKDRRGNHIYHDLYLKENANDLRTIYGQKGRACIWGGRLTEVNFGMGRYVVAIGAQGVGNFTERDFILRAERLQLEKGGYGQSKKSEQKETEESTTSSELPQS